MASDVFMHNPHYLSQDALAFVPRDSSVDIAPWTLPDEPPTPPPKQPRSFGFNAKASIASFSPQRSAPSRADSQSRSVDGSIASSSADRHEPRKQKSSMNLFNRLKRSRSKPRLDSDEHEYPSSVSLPPPLPSYISQESSFLSLGPTPSRTLKKEKAKEKKKGPTPPTNTSSTASEEPEVQLDLDIEQMDGIIDRSRLPPPPPVPPVPDAVPITSSAGAVSLQGSDDVFFSSSPPQPSESPPHMKPMFHDPFMPSTVHARKAHLNFDRKVSPRTRPPIPIAPVVVPQQLLPPIKGDLETEWDPPESWAVDKHDDPDQEPEYSSSEEGSAPKQTPDTSPHDGGHGSAPSKRKSRRRATTTTKPAKPTTSHTYKIRVHLANNTYHVLSLGLAVTVSTLIPLLKGKLKSSDSDVYRLYLKERGRERILAHTERPADIVRRRLEQAGYDVADGLEVLGEEDLSFLLKFVYKSNVLGPPEEDLVFNNWDEIDLTNKSLRTIPIALYRHAEAIRCLNLSRNPMVEIPLDFVQSCTGLQELRLSNMSIKKVPQSVRHCTTLFGLDLSCNRIADLDVGLDRIPDLTNLMVQNNRMETLPWYFPRLRSLRIVNISNNKFQVFPEVLCKMEGLTELDISFNMISELPDDIGQLCNLERLVIVGNRINRFPDGCSKLQNLRQLDCRRNNIEDLAVVAMLPRLEELRVNYNAVHALDLSAGPCVAKVDVSHNDITQLTLVPGPIGQIPLALTTLNISHAKLSSLDDLALAQLTSLEVLNLDYNNFRSIPESLGELSHLVSFSCSDNSLDGLPASIGRLQKLERLDVHNNNLGKVPVSLWNCGSLRRINMTSNLISEWPHPPAPTPTPATTPTAAPSMTLAVPEITTSPPSAIVFERKVSTASTTSLVPSPRALPPLASSLWQLYLGENTLTDEALPVLTILRKLTVLNLSFNDIQEMPRSFFREMTCLEALYLSGNKLASLPTEDLHRLNKLDTLFLNGNRLQTLPQELAKVPSLTVLDVGSNVLKYNVNNWEFDWNWNFNKNLVYLNLSGNKRLEIRPDQSRKGQEIQTKKVLDLAGFSGLEHLRVLGLMDVTTTFARNIPDDNEERRVRTSLSEVNSMAYGIADNLGRGRDYVSMFDLVQPAFRDRDEAIFAMFGRAQASPEDSRTSKYLHDNFVPIFAAHLGALNSAKGETVQDALRRTFLKLNRYTHDFIFSGRTLPRKMSLASNPSNTSTPELSNWGASGIVAYIRDKTLYVANAGNALAVVSRRGTAEIVATKHDPFDRNEIARIRAAEGWVSPKGLVNDEVNVSRSFGFYHLLPVVNARPDVYAYRLSELDEFIIIANSGLWDYVSYQTAVDIARSERGDPMIAAQKLRDFAISYGAEGSTMIMVISTSSLFQSRSRQATVESLVDSDLYTSTRRRQKDQIGDRNIARLDEEVDPPTGHITLVFTDIRNSTHLWETNAGMPVGDAYASQLAAASVALLRRTVSAALLWSLNVQLQLLNEPWPQEILNCEDGREIRDANGNVIARGLSLRMGIHCGSPVCEIDQITKRMDYYGPMVNRAARVCTCAQGGQIMVSTDVVREIEARILEVGPDTDHSMMQPPHVVDAIRRLHIEMTKVGEVKLKGLEVPETLTLVFPGDLAGRRDMDEESITDVGANQVLCSVEELRELAMLSVRLQALAGNRVFRALAPRKGSNALPAIEAELDALGNGSGSSNDNDGDSENAALYLYGDPATLLPPIPDKPSETEFVSILELVLLQLEIAVTGLSSRLAPPEVLTITTALKGRNGRPIDPQTLERILSLLAA
ncbi:hypothetical protein EVG20_g1385 [Dentipellis fragilis]|uniref:Adenylate cyclase n=1 Tax=Dentipellis fragilis TaxID=205917 RepID=A0A4Y9ZAR0_9AGAM|nr:hypothetical protein EVG20_g1385 [Dentipellis fragilis]